MIKVTLPNGIAVEGDSASEVGLMIDILHSEPEKSDPAPVITIVPTPTPTPTPKPELPAEPPDKKFLHKIGESKGCIKIGGRQDQILRAAKLLAEVADDHRHEFTAAQVADLLGLPTSPVSTTVSSALHSLLKAGALRHGANRNLWSVTARGWSARFRVVQPIRAND